LVNFSSAHLTSNLGTTTVMDGY